MNSVKKFCLNRVGNILFIAGPVKNLVKRADCKVHIYLNYAAIKILKIHGLYDIYYFYVKYLSSFNNGVSWADQNLKNKDHFYNPNLKRGLFHKNNMRKLFVKYYGKALFFYKVEKYKEAVFYLGAAVHLVQDATVPFHATVLILKGHKKYEKWIKKNCSIKSYFIGDADIVHYENFTDYIDENCKLSMYIYEKYKGDENMYENMSSVLKNQAKATTAGLLVDFYKKTADLDQLRI